MSPFRGDARGYGPRSAAAKLAAALAALVLLAGAAAAEVRILALGDSLTAGYGLPDGAGFVPRLEAWLAANGAPDVEIVNGGVSGDTSAGGLARIDWALQDDIDAVIVALGGNDMLRGIDPAVTRANLDGILDAIGAKGLPAVLAGLPAPPNYPADFRKAYKAMFRDLAKEHGATYYSSFLGGLGQGRSVREIMLLFQSDGLHPNAEGVQAIVEHIGPVVLRLADEARER
jgi:acyl-CoA thioesterase-1